MWREIYRQCRFYRFQVWKRREFFIEQGKRFDGEPFRTIVFGEILNLEYPPSLRFSLLDECDRLFSSDSVLLKWKRWGKSQKLRLFQRNENQWKSLDEMGDDWLHADLQ